MNIDDKTIESLEFDLVKKRLQSLCSGHESRQIVENQPFIDDANELKEQHHHLGELLQVYQSDGEISSQLPSIGFLFKYLEPENAVASADELYLFALFFSEAKKLINHLAQPRDLFPNSQPSYFSLLPEIIPNDSREILSTFDSEGNLLESHPDVKALIKQKRSLNQDINFLSSSFIKKDQEFWQDNRPVLRDGRLLMPLKANYKGRIKGVIHEVSSSGNTLFIEPYEMLELNNRMVELDNKKAQIRLKWIKHFSRRIHADLSRLDYFYQTVLTIDVLSAKARYARLYDCTQPKFDSGFNLHSAVHPGLGKSAVPIDIIFDNQIRMVVISGPNAGGKTVSLKTAALAVLMNQFGLFIHSGEGSSLPLFGEVFAAIGDNQSIEEGVSTFSGYMKRVSKILLTAHQNSLVLLDELGSGTDPAEGSVLGVAILDEISRSGATVMVTTHHKDIRNYAQATDFAVNASVQFDEKRHLPTYQLKTGFPGESRALDIAAASGIPANLISHAGKLFEKNRSDSMRLMENLSRKEQELAVREEEIIADENRVIEKSRKADLKELKLKQQELEIRKDRQLEVSRFVRQTRSELENLVSDLQCIKKKNQDDSFSSVPTGRVKDFIKTMEASAAKEASKIDDIENQVVRGTGYVFSVGMKVLVGKYRRKGEIVQKEKKNSWLIATDSLKIAVKESDLVPDESVEKREGIDIQVYRADPNLKAQLQVDMRGMTLIEAKQALYTQIELAIMGNLSSFSLIHGLGTGVLQQGIRAELAKMDMIKDFHYARPENGGHGKTEVVLFQ